MCKRVVRIFELMITDAQIVLHKHGEKIDICFSSSSRAIIALRIRLFMEKTISNY
jgi:hypothetical protein